MSAFLPRQNRGGGQRHGVTLPVLLVLTLVSAATGAVVALLAERVAQRYRAIEVLPVPAPIRELREADSEPASEAPPLTPPRHGEGNRPPGRSAMTGESPLGAVAANLPAARAAELEAIVNDDIDVIAGDGSNECPVEFPIKGNGRSGIYHWPGSHNYPQTHPTLCFRTTDAAERAGFRRASR